MSSEDDASATLQKPSESFSADADDVSDIRDLRRRIRAAVTPARMRS
jgi:hypothetical protein